MKIETVVFTGSYGLVEQLKESDLPEVVFSGRSNVGKSSLINKILNRKSFARISSTPGKTITINFYGLDTMYLVDLPGYGYAKRSKGERDRWSDLVEGYFSSQRKIGLMVQLIDMRHPPTEDDLNMLKYIKAIEHPFIIIYTKSDKLNKTQREERLQSLEKDLAFLGEDVKKIPFSALTGEGLESVKEQLINVEKQRNRETEI